MIRTSVIIPVYNTADYLAACVDSVLAQTQKETEIILVDDGSTDGSLAIAQRYAADLEQVTLLTQEHQFQGTARNRGLKEARGEFVYFMDSDDLIRPELFEKCYAACVQRDLDFVMFDSEGFVYDENDTELAVPDDICDRRNMGIGDGIYTGPEFWNRFYARHGVLYVCWLLYIRRDFLLANDLRYEERTYFEDNDWMLRMYLCAERTAYLPEFLHLHRWRRGSNMLSGFTADLLKGCFRMHRVLTGLLSGEESPAKRKMIEDVLRLNTRRFDRLAEVPDTEEYFRPLSEFLSECVLRADRYENLAVLYRALRSTEGWKCVPGDPEPLRKLAGALVRGTSRRVVIYGAGKMGEILCRLLEAYGELQDKTVVFADEKKAGQTVFGRPCLAPLSIAAFAPDEILLGSVKFAREMKDTLDKVYTGNAKITKIPEGMRFFL